MPLGSGIFVEFMRLPRTGELNSYLVFRDGTGDARVIAGAPESFTGDTSGRLEIDQPVETSRAAYGPSNSYKTRQAVKLPTGGRPSEEVWGQMTADAEALRRTGRVDNVMGNTKVVNAINLGLLDNAGIDWQPYIGANKLADMTGFDDASAEPVKQALRSLRPIRPDAPIIRANPLRPTEEADPVPAPPTIRATRRPPSQPVITPENPESGRITSRSKGSTVLKGDPGVHGVEKAKDALGVGNRPWGFDDETMEEPEVIRATPLTTGKPGSDDEPPAPSAKIGDHSLAAKQSEIFGENGVPYKAFGFSEEQAQKFDMAEDELNEFLTRLALSAFSDDPAMHLAMIQEIDQAVGPHSRYVASYLKNHHSKLVQEGPGVFAPYRREVERENEKKKMPPRAWIPMQATEMSEAQIQERLNSRSSLTDLFGLESDLIKNVSQGKLKLILAQIVDLAEMYHFDSGEAVKYGTDLQNNILLKFGIDHFELQTRLNDIIKRLQNSPKHVASFKYLTDETLERIYKEKTGKGLVGKFVGFAIQNLPGPGVSGASSLTGSGSSIQINTLRHEFYRRGIACGPAWLYPPTEYN